MPKGLPFQPRHYVGLSMIATLMGTALISPLYPIYQDHWGLSAGDINNIYVLYMIGALAGLVFLGRLGDRIGFVATLLIALCLALIGSLVCMMAQDMAVLSAGRILVGISGTLATSSGVAGLNILAPEAKKPHVALKGSLMVAGGFGLGPVIGGIVGQWVPMPLVSVHIPVLVMIVAGLVIMSRIAPRMTLSEMRERLTLADFMPKLAWPKGSEGVTFALATVLPFITFGVFGLYVSMIPSILRNVLGVGGPMISGGGIAMMLVGSCLTQIALKRMYYFKAALIGLTLLAVSNGILILNLSMGSALLFGIGVVIAAMGHGSSMFAGAQVVNMISDNTNRSSLTASFWAVGYCGSILPMIGTGMMADRWGLSVAVTVFCSGVIVMCAAGAALFILVAAARRKKRLEAA